MNETMVDAKVTYTLEHGGEFFIVENVPARVCKETGEQFFAPDTVENIQAIIKSKKKPDRVIETSVYECAREHALRASPPDRDQALSICPQGSAKL
jgi:YgiT-type zinc finger domain-containing protein